MRRNKPDKVLFTRASARLFAVLAVLFVLTTCDLFKTGLGDKVDITAPVVDATSLSNGSYVHGAITLSGSATDDTGVKSVTVLVNSGATLLATIPATMHDHTWSAVLDTAAISPNQEVQVDLTIRATDDSGKISDRKLVLYFDNVKPVVTSIMPDPTNLSDPNNFLSEIQSIQGSVLDGFGVADLNFTAGTLRLPIAAGTTAGNWKVNVDCSQFVLGANGAKTTLPDNVTPLAAGLSRVPFTIVATDNAGNISTPVTSNFYVSADGAPVITLQTGINSGILFPNTDPLNNGTNLAAPGSTIVARIHTINSLDPASIKVTLTGHSIGSKVYTVVSGLAMTTILQSGTKLQTVDVSATIPSLLALQPDALGEYRLDLEASDDPASKLSGIAAKRTVSGISLFIDEGMPIVAVTMPANGAFLQNFVISAATLDSGLIPSYVTIKIDGGAAQVVNAATAPSNGHFTLAVNHADWGYIHTGSALAEGSHTAYIQGYDIAGKPNTPPLGLQFTIDTTKPSVSVQTVLPATTPASLRPNAFADVAAPAAPGGELNTVNGIARFKGTGTDETALKTVTWKIQHASSITPWTLDAVAVDSGSFLASAMSLWSLDVDTTAAPYVDGNYYVLTLTATDQAGNLSDPAVSGVRAFKVNQSTDTPLFSLVNMTTAAVDSSTAKLNLLVNKIQLDASVADDDRVNAATLSIYIDKPDTTGAADDTIIGTQNVDGSVSFSYSFATTSAGHGKALGEGRHWFHLKVSDDAAWKNGKAAASAVIGPVWFAIDTTQPQISFDQTGTIYVSTSQALSGTVSSANALDAPSPFTLTYTGVTAHAPDSLAAPASTGSHAWSYVLNVGSIADGPLNVVAKAKDEFGLESQQSFIVTVDKAGPDTLTCNNPGQIFTEISTLLNGMVGDTTSGIASLTAVVKLGPVVQALPPVTWSAQAGLPSPTGANWSLDTTSLVTGNYTLTLTATDKAGNATVSSVFNFLVDKDLPTVVITLPADAAIYNAPFGVTGIASGTASDTYLSKVQYRIDGGAWTDATGTSSWSFDTGWASLAEGPHTISATAQDQGGHTATQAVTFTKDTIAPTASYGNISGAGGSVLNETVSSLTGTLNEATTFIASGSVIFDIGTGSVTTYPLVIPPSQKFFAWSQDITTLPEGTHTVTVHTADTAGNNNTAAAPTVSFVVDRSPPTVTVTPLAGGQFKAAAFAVAGTAGEAFSGLKSVVLTVDAAPLTVTGTSAWTANVAGATFTALAEGQHTLTATSADNAGHSASASISFIKDTISPNVTFGNIVGGANTLLNESFNALTGTVSDASSGIASMQIKMDGGALQSLGTPAGATSQGWNWDISVLADGTHTVEVQTADQAGNTGTTGAVSFRVDRHPPVVVITTPGANGIFSAGFGAPPGTASGTAAHVFLTTVQYQVDGAAFTPATGTTSWTAALTWAGLSDGQHTITVQASDAAAHVTSASVTFKKDATPPAASYTNLTTTSPWTIYQQAGTKISGSLSDTNGVATAQYMVEHYAAGSWTVSQALTSLGATGNATSFSWNVDLATWLDGHYRITIQSTDVATPANTLASGPYEFYIDTAAPAATIGVIVNDTIVSVDPGTPSGTGSDANLTALTVQLDATAAQDAFATAPAWSYVGWNWAALPEGHHTLTVTATDIAARTTTATVAFTKDTTAPAASYTNLATTSPWTIYQQAGMKISGSLSDATGVASAQYHVEQYNGVSWLPYRPLTSLGATGNATSFPWNLDLASYPDGHYRLSILSSDAAVPANTLANGPYEFYVDTAAPTASLAAPVPGLIVAADFGAPTGSAADANLVTALVQLDASAPVNVFATAGSWTYPSWNWAAIADGQHTLSLTATDVVGRVTTSTVTFIKDTSPPTVSYNNLSTGPMTVLQSPNAVLSGILSDANGVASANYTLQKWNYGTLAWDPVPGATAASFGATANAKNYPWSIDIGSTGLNLTDSAHDGKYRLSMAAQDVVSTPNLLDTGSAPVQFMISLSNPAAAVTSPGPGLYENSDFRIDGTAGDANTVTSVLVKAGSGSVSFASGTTAALATLSVTLNLVSDTFTAASPHGLAAGNIVYFTGSSLPATSGGTIASATPYYVIAAGLTGTTFEVSTSSGGAAVDFTGNGSGMAVGSSVIPFGTSASWMVPALPVSAFSDGSLTAFVQVTAGSGRIAVTSRDFTLDKAAPVISVTSPVSGSRTVGNLTINGTSTDPGASPSGMAAVAQYQLGKNANLGNPASWTNATGGAYSWSMDLGLMNSYSNSTYATECDTSGLPASGTNLWKLPVYFQALDKAGNLDQVTTYYLILDPNGNVPVVLVSQPTQSGATFGGMVRISGTAVQPIWIHDVEVAIDPAGGTNFPASPLALTITGSTLNAANTFTNGMMVFLAGTTAPQIGGSNVSATTPYFVVNRAATTFQVSTTSGGAPVPFSSAGSGVSASPWAAATLTTQGNSVNWYYDVNQNNVYPQSGTSQSITVQVRAWNSPTPGGARGTVSGTLNVPLGMNFNATFPHFVNMKIGPDSNPVNGVGYFSQITVSRQFYVLGTVSTSKGLSRLERLEGSPLSGASTIYDFTVNGSSAAATSSAPYSSTTVTPPTAVSAGSFPTDGTTRVLITAVGSVSNWSGIGGPNPATVGVVFTPTGNGAGLTGAAAMVSDGTGEFNYTVAMSVDSAQLYNNTTGIYSFDFRATDLTSGSPQVSSTTITLNEDNYYPSSTLTSSASLNGSLFKIQGSATDVGAGFGSIQGLRKVVVYIEKGGQIVDFTGGSAVAPVTISARDWNNGGTVGSVIYPPVEKTGGSFSSGHTYEILTPGSTNFTAIGAASNAVGTVFTATGSGAGSGTAVDLSLTAKYSPYIDNKGEVGSSDTNQDGFIESFLINGNSMDWWAQFDSTGLPDGAVNVHYVIFDNAGNATHYQQSAYVSNHAPSISTVVLGTDLNGDGSITGAAPNETQTFNNGFLATGFTARNRLLSFQVNAIYGGQNGALSYSLKKGGHEFWGDTGTSVVGNTITINFAAITTAIADASGNSALFVLTVTDSTSGGGQSASVTVGMNIQNVDSVAPTLAIAPFGQRYNVPVDAGNGGAVTDTGKSLGAVGAYTDNVATSGPTLLGHVEYAADSIFADGRPNLSGQVVFRGKAFDNQRINRITATIPGFDGGAGVGAEFPVATWGGASLTGLSGTGWSFASDASSEGVSQADGHALNWALTWDSSLIASVAAANLTATIKIYDFMTSGTGATRGSTTTLTSTQLVGMTIPNGTPVFIGPTNATWTTVTTFNSGTGLLTFATAVPTAGNASYTVANVTPASMTVDVVPYVTRIVTRLSSAYNAKPSVFDRTAKGHYPVAENEVINLYGFNFNGTSTAVSVGATALAAPVVPDGLPTTHITVNVGATAISGALSLSVGAVAAANNLNPNARTWDQEPNGVNNDLLTDDRSLDIWKFNNVETNGAIKYPMMRISPTQQVGFTYGDIESDFVIRVDAARTVYEVSPSKYAYNAMAFDQATPPNFYALALDTDRTNDGFGGSPRTGANSSTKMNFFSRQLGSGNAYPGSYQPGTYKKQLEANWNGFQYNSVRSMYPDMVAKSPAVPTDLNPTKIYMVYYDQILGQTKFRYGTVGLDGNTMDYGLALDLDPLTANAIPKIGSAGLPNEGTIGTPVNLAHSVSRSANVTAANNAYYKVAVEPNNTYTFVLDALTGNADLQIYSDAAFTTQVGTSTNAGTATEFIDYLTTGAMTNVYVRVTGTAASNYRLSYNDRGTAGNYQIVGGPSTTYNGGPYAGIGVTSGGTAVVAWYDKPNTRLMYSWNTDPSSSGGNSEGQWQTNAVVLDSDFSGWFVDVAVDGADAIHIAYYNSANGDLRYVYIPTYNGAPSAPKTVDSFLSVGSNITIMTKLVGSDWVPYISYYMGALTATRNSLRVAYRTNFASLNNGADANDKYTGDWEVTSIPASNIPKDNTVSIGFKDLGAKLLQPILGYATEVNLETAQLK